MIRRLLPLCLALALTIPHLPAQEPSEGPPGKEPAGESPATGEGEGPEKIARETIMELLQTDDETEFAKKLADAKGKGLGPQGATEVKMVRAYHSQDPAKVTTALAEAEVALPDYQAKDAIVFPSKENFQSFISVLRGMDAHAKGDEAKVKENFLEAFWNDPEQGPQIAELLKSYRSKDKMATLVLPMDTEFATTDGGKTTLAKLVEGKKAILADFWASWCEPCMKLMDELGEAAKALESQGIVVVGINTEDASEAAKADKVKTDNKFTMPWLIEPVGKPFTQALGIESIPRQVLITPDGKVHFNSHPKDEKLKEALAKLGAKVGS